MGPVVLATTVVKNSVFGMFGFAVSSKACNISEYPVASTFCLLPAAHRLR
jgi:hypothetical protein